jgi:hypothetical protein
MSIVLKRLITLGCLATVSASVSTATDVPVATQDKYSLKVPGRLAFSEFKGYESWQAISVSYDQKAVALILANPVMVDAYKAGIPVNGKRFPDGAKMAKIHWIPQKSELFPSATVAGTQKDVDFMVKDSRRFIDGGGWGYAVFKYDATSKTFRPGEPPAQANDATCGVACHSLAKDRDYVFTEYATR